MEQEGVLQKNIIFFFSFSDTIFYPRQEDDDKGNERNFVIRQWKIDQK